MLRLQKVKNRMKKNKYMYQLGITVWKLSKYGVFSGPYFLVFCPNMGKYGPE